MKQFVDTGKMMIVVLCDEKTGVSSSRLRHVILSPDAICRGEESDHQFIAGLLAHDFIAFT